MKNPNWLDPLLYPFTYHALETGYGKMHYVDEGEGEAILFVHGTPTWSFVWRQQIRSLSTRFRCVAPDNIGFGLSDKPSLTNFNYAPEAHAANLEAFVNGLNLKNITLVVHDFGGPIGLAYAQKYPDNVKRIVVLNTWMWSLANEEKMMKVSRFLSGSFGKFLYLNLGFSAKFLLPRGYSKRNHLSKDIHQHYLKPLSTASKRMGTWQFAKALSASNSFFESLWQEKKSLESIPKLILWGEKDALLPLHFRDQWSKAYPESKVVTFKAGHFLQEEKGSEVADQIKAFMLES